MAPHQFYVVDPDQAEVAVGSWVQLVVRGQLEDSTWEDATAEYWTGDDESVATVDTAGTVIAVAPGTVNVTAMVESASGTAAFALITVPGGAAPVAQFYVVAPDQAEVAVGSWAQLVVRGQLEDGTWEDATAEYWTGDDESVATVDTAGTVIAVAPGTVNVTAMVDSATGTVAFGQVTVTS